MYGLDVLQSRKMTDCSTRISNSSILTYHEFTSSRWFGHDSDRVVQVWPWHWCSPQPWSSLSPCLASAWRLPKFPVQPGQHQQRWSDGNMSSMVHTFNACIRWLVSDASPSSPAESSPVGSSDTATRLHSLSSGAIPFAWSKPVVFECVGILFIFDNKRGLPRGRYLKTKVQTRRISVTSWILLLKPETSSPSLGHPNLSPQTAEHANVRT